MKVTVNENTEWKEDEIIINCAYMDERMKNLVDYVRQFAFSLEGEIDGKFYQLNDRQKWCIVQLYPLPANQRALLL